MPNNVLVLGGNGMAGHIIALYLSQCGYNVTTLCRNDVLLSRNIKNIIWDENFDSLKNIINLDFDVIINCIGILNSKCDEDPVKAVKINAYLPHFLSRNILNKKNKIIHISTDCVFSGANPPCDEFSIPDGNTIYDVTKATGELICGDNIIVLRNSIIGPDMNKNGIGLFNWFMKQENEIDGYDNWIWSGITTLELAKQINCLIKLNINGLLHLSNNISISKYDLLNLFNKITNRSIVINKKELNNKIDKTLINSKNNNPKIIPSYHEMIVEMWEWIKKNKVIYNYAE